MNLSHEEVVEILRQADIFSTLPDELLVELAPHMLFRDAAPGEAIVTEGQHGENMYVIVAGKALVTSRRQVLHELGPGNILGEISLVLSSNRTASVVAADAMQLLQLDRESFLKLVRQRSEVMSEIVREFGVHVQRLMDMETGQPLPVNAASVPDATEIKIEIDVSGFQQEISRIVDTAFFQDLQAKSRKWHNRS